MTDNRKQLFDDEAALRQTRRAGCEMPLHAKFAPLTGGGIEVERERLPERVRKLPAREFARGNQVAGVGVDDRDSGDERSVAVEVIDLEFKICHMTASRKIIRDRSLGKITGGAIAERIGLPGVEAVEAANVVLKI